MTHVRDPRLPEDLETDIAARLDAISSPRPRGLRKWKSRQLVLLWLLIVTLGLGLYFLPNHLFDPEVIQITYVLGAIGVWRYGWWANHALRSEMFMASRWPRLRARRDRVWAKGWRPSHLHIQMTTYKENPAITRHVMRALCHQIRDAQIPATIWIGTGALEDELVIEAFATEEADDLDAEIVFIRQNQPGKRMAIGLIMRAICRTAPDPDELIVFMDGDTVFGEWALEKSLAMFGADPELQAVTTDEEVIAYGPGWMRRWLDLRFSQRRLVMQSHTMSDKVLTLTGRMSVFRALHICNERFIRTIEADHLDHWLWGRFRFLSGDDKSTWFWLLSRGFKMAYVPDATVATIEIVEGNGVDRMVQNLRRWSGNMLRNGSRALALGPARVGLFIWWCVLDQRLAIWTMLISPVLALLAAFMEPGYLIGVGLWIVISRLVLTLYLFRYARAVDLAWPFLLYANQLINACVKVWLQFFPAKQRWANRGGQVAGAGGAAIRLRNSVAWSQMAISLMTFVYLVAWLTGRAVAPISF
ncbi:MAG: glycosyltransferase [Pseudomonadota bacterium]